MCLREIKFIDNAVWSYVFCEKALWSFQTAETRKTIEEIWDGKKMVKLQHGGALLP